MTTRTTSQASPDQSSATLSANLSKYKAVLGDVAKRTLGEMEVHPSVPSLKKNIDELNQLKTTDKENYYKQYSAVNAANCASPYFFEHPDLRDDTSCLKILSAIFADSEIKGTDLEGFSLKASSSILEEYISHAPPNSLPKNVHTEFTQFLKTLSATHTAPQIAEALVNLPAGKSFGMQGGWCGKPGHAMVYEFVKLKNGNFDLYIYNTGAGTGYFYDVLTTENKSKIRPFIRYADVFPEELGLNPAKHQESELSLFEYLLKLQVPSDDKREPKDIYETAFGHLQSKIVKGQVVQDMTGFMTSQRAGTCFWKVLMAMMRKRLGSLKDYKTWHFSERFDALVSFWNTCKFLLIQNSSQGESARLLVSLACKKMHTEAVKLHAEGLISIDLEKKVDATASDLSEKVAGLEKEIAENRKKDSRAIVINRDHIAEKPLNDLLTCAQKEIYKEAPSSDSVQSNLPLTYGAYQITAPDFSKVLGDLNAHLKLCLKENDRAEAIYSIESLSHVLPILDKKFWESIPQTQLTPCLNSLSEIIETYGQLVLQPRATLPQQQNTAMALLASHLELAQRIDPKLKNYGIFVEPFLDLLANDKYLVFYHPDTLRRHIELKRYFTGRNNLLQDKLLFEFTKSVPKGDSISFKSYPDSQYLDDAMRTEDFNGGKCREDLVLQVQNHISNDTEAQKHFTKNDPVIQTAFLLAKPEKLAIGKKKPEYLALRRTAFLSRLFCGQTKEASEQHTREQKPNFESKLVHYSWTPNIHLEYRFGTEEKFDFVPLKELHHLKSAKQLDACITDTNPNLFSHRDAAISPESNVLNNWKSAETPFAWRKTLACTNCEPSLQPGKLIYDSMQHIPEVENSDSQTLFNLMLFKVLDKEPATEHLFDETLKNPHFIEQCNRYIERGLQYYYKRKGNRPLKVPAVLFFVRLAQRLKAINPKAAVSDCSSFINQWLSEAKDPKDLALLHLHRITQHAVTPPELLTDQAKGECIESWVYFCNENVDPEWAEKDIVQTARNFIYLRKLDLLTALSNPAVRNRALNNTARSIGLPIQDNIPWEENLFPVYTQKSSEGFWSINILNGKIANETGLTSQGECLEIYTYPNYLSLFGSEKFAFKRMGRFHYLANHPVYGEVRIKIETEQTAITRNGGVVQRKIDGEWHQYFNARNIHYEIATNHLPLPLIADHEHWIPISSKEKKASQLELFIAEKQKPKFSYRVASNGIGSIPFKCSTLSAAATDPELNQVFRGFEATNCILAEKTFAVNTLRLPRFRSLNGNELSFFYPDDQMPGDFEPKWKENPSFVLASSQPNGLMGSVIENSTLCLVDKKTKKYKVLVPLSPIKGPKTYDRRISLLSGDQSKEIEQRVPNTSTKISEYTDNPANPQRGTRTFVEYDYDLDERRPIALNQEGSFYLAYVSLAQKNYPAAWTYLDTIPQGMRLTQKSLEILRWMAFEDGKVDPSGSSAAVKLLAALRIAEHEQSLDRLLEETGKKKVISEEEKKALSKDKEEKQQKIEALYDIYRNRENNIDGKVRLDRDKLSRLASCYQLAEEIKSDGIPSTSTVDFSPYRVHPRHSLQRAVSLDYHFSDIEDVANKISLSPTTRAAQGSKLQASFGYYYSKAKKGDQKELVRLSLCLHFLDKGDYVSYNELLSPETLMSLIHYAMRFPNEAPELPKIAGGVEKLGWMKNLISLHMHNQARSNDLPFFPQKYVKNNASLRPVSKVADLNTIAARVHQRNGAPSGPLTFTAPQHLSPLDLQTLCGNYFESGNQPEPEPATFKEPPTEFPESVEEFVDAIRSEFDGYKQGEFQKGVKVNKERANKILTLKKNADIVNMRKDFDRVIKDQDGRLEQLKFLIEEFANLKKESENELTQTHLDKAGFTRSVDIENLITMFLYGNPKQYAAANPNLNEEERKILHGLIGHYLVHAADLQQVKRASLILEKLEGMENDAKLAGTPVDPEIRDLYLSNIGTELDAKVVYKPGARPELLAYEYRANLRIRPKQYGFIEMMQRCKAQDRKKYRDIIIQMLMGGGKTSVLATTFLLYCILQGKLALFVPPGAQFEPLRNILAYNLKNYFGMDLLPIQLPRDKMTPETVKTVLDQLKAAPSKRQVGLIKSEQIQSFQLELLSLLNLYKTDKRDSISEEILLLHDVENLLHTATYLIDEVDLIMAPVLETNFPRDPGKKLTPEYVELMRQIAELHITHMPELCQNKQTEVGPDKYTQKILPAVARELAKQNLDMQIPPELLDSYVRYALGEFEKDIKKGKPLSENDQKLLSHIRNLGNDPDKDEDNLLAAGLIDMSKYFLSKIFPETIKKSTGQKYDRLKTWVNGHLVEISPEVVPYEGFDHPSTTKFGNPWEAAAFHYQTALFKKASRIQIETLARILNTSAEHFMNRRKEDFDRTQEAIQFFKLTGVHLGEIDLPGKLDEAVANVNKDLKKVLLLEQELICDVVRYYPDHYGSNSQDLGEQISGSSVAVFGGTPWNWLTYPEFLLDGDIELEIGTEGQIAEEMLRRQDRLKKRGVPPIHNFENATVKDILDSARFPVKPDSTRGENPRKDLFRAIIDTGAVLKNYASNEEAAREILDYYKDDDNIQYVFFYGRKSQDDLSPKHPMALKKGHPPEIIHFESTKKEHILRGLGKREDQEEEIHKIFYLYDEKHTEATDLPLAPWAVSILTLSADERFIARTFYQGALRPRQYFKKQDHEFAIQTKERELLLNKGVDLNDAIHTYYKNQAILKSKELSRAYGHRVRKIFRGYIMQTIRAAARDADRLLRIYTNYEKILLTGQKEVPFSEPGALDNWMGFTAALFGPDWASGNLQIDKLGGLAGQIYHVFASCTAEHEALENVKKGLIDLQARVKKDLKYLPAGVFSSSVGDNLGEEMNIAMAMLQEAQKMSERELERDLEEELNRYQIAGNMYHYVESIWTQQDLLEFPHPATTVAKVSSLPQSFQPIPDAAWKYEHPYGKIFDDTLFVTSNYLRTTSIPLPVFDHRQKQAEQILIIDQGPKLVAVILSIKEAALFKRYIEGSPSRYAQHWIILPDGSEFTNHTHVPLDQEKKKQLEKILFHANFYSGNANYLDLHEKESKEFLEQDTQLKLRFLKLRVEKDPTQRKIFDNSPVLNLAFNPSAAPLQCAERRAQLRDLRLKNKGLTPRLVAALNPAEFDFTTLGVPMVKWLVTKDQIAKLDNARHLVGLTPAQIPMLSDAQFPLLPTKRKDLINATPDDKLHLLTKDQVQVLDKVKIEKLPNDRVPDVSIRQIKNGYLYDFQYAFVSDLQASATPAGKVTVLADFNPNMLSFLKNKDQIENIPVGDYRHLDKTQVKYIPVSRVEDLTALRPDLIRHLSGEEQLGEVPLDKMGQVDANQIVYLNSGQLDAYYYLKPPSPPPTSDANYAYAATMDSLGLLREELQKDFDNFTPQIQKEVLARISSVYSNNRVTLTAADIGPNLLLRRLDLFQNTVVEIAKTDRDAAASSAFLSMVDHLCVFREQMEREFQIFPSDFQKEVCEKISYCFDNTVKDRAIGRTRLIERLDFFEDSIQAVYSSSIR